MEWKTLLRRRQIKAEKVEFKAEIIHILTNLTITYRYTCTNLNNIDTNYTINIKSSTMSTLSVWDLEISKIQKAAIQLFRKMLGTS